MRWRARSIRHSSDLPPDGEATLRPHTGLGGVELAGAGSGGPGFGRLESQKPGLGQFLARSMESKSDSGSGTPLDRTGIAPKTARINDSSVENRQESAHGAQPSGADGVEEDMATLVLDNSALGVGGAGTGPARLDADHGANAALDPASDAAIMLRVAAGDEAGFNYLVQKYHRAIIHFLFRMVRNEAVAEEMAQEVFLRVYRSRESYRAEAKFTTWLYRIATNLAVNHARDTKHERSAQTIYLDAPDEETGSTPDVADDEPSVEQRLMRDERMAAIRKHVMDLPERQRMAVLMHKYQGMDYRQIGDVLKLSESATKSLLFRAYQTLRDKLKEFV
jgi:RNA polymerase sigma-70 factor, ECF subfamily